MTHLFLYFTRNCLYSLAGKAALGKQCWRILSSYNQQHWKRSSLQHSDVEKVLLSGIYRWISVLHYHRGLRGSYDSHCICDFYMRLCFAPALFPSQISAQLWLTWILENESDSTASCHYIHAPPPPFSTGIDTWFLSEPKNRFFQALTLSYFFTKSPSLFRSLPLKSLSGGVSG